MLGLAILLAFNLIGIGLQTSLHIPLPGNVIGLILFTIALFTKLIKLEWVEQTANWFTGHMMLFFLPFVVGTMAFFPLIGANWLSIGAGVIGSTALVLIVTGFVTSKLQRGADTGAGTGGKRGRRDELVQTLDGEMRSTTAGRTTPLDGGMS
ncbi:CidA/LrgA family protein [Paenibacillus whitsoniae]|uniref:CidA/LrgA family protein n=1 Tax=Paenibacillus whitsoniae TaxID=2496558 RepID=A0A3S0API1_9BACL|nr:CidA/LrgA family protein [Paenibacillus whitsoniae]RTE09356.1 CidA/LrgA family protein [Paenibacillus whitsoniae]